ncbi:PP2C family protein-serine/threonine phosphatase [Ktedonobacter racemifer]|uniref:Protein serine/threonine phosphatase n=1 Tax=Ktedonobacter racemifer DSM 44963 TaxID=485913 RepID=D6TQ40_KTERA|nr:PP2C family serine/threonine-protein phosphatase [Ktedonobacter racemifer]EFH85688.1 protein serine/threonine phosphatase [Ktedonobacter racemifer DSM 44963]
MVKQCLRNILGNQFVIESANHKRAQLTQSEDYIFIDQDTGLLGVFDSVGGRDKGQLVSRLAGRTIAASWKNLATTNHQKSLAQIEIHLRAVLQQADTVIAALHLPSGEKRPATTATVGVLSLQNDEVYMTIANVGDSRAYLLRSGKIQRLTEDNGYFPWAIRRGILTKEESWRIEQVARDGDLSLQDMTHFRRRNKITCAVGWADFPPIQPYSLALTPGDRIVICTDGLHDNLTDEEIAEVLQGPPEHSAQRLISAAYHRSQQPHIRAKEDDISAIVAWYMFSQAYKI